jgi:hypothetical protein
MRFRLGLLFGLLVGYVLGAKAGRERYEQIMGMWSNVKATEPAQTISQEMANVAEVANEVIEEKATETAAKVTSMVRGDSDASSSSSGGSSSSSGTGTGF